MKKISVIVPVYNAEQFLKKCIDSILNQTYNNIELILVDDGSLDNSLSICEEYSKKDRRVKVLHKVNGGVSSARNIGLEHASGDLISFIDADDALENDMYEYLLKIMEESNADISHCGYKRLNESDEVLNEFFGTGEIILLDFTTTLEYMFQGKKFNCGLWNKLYKSEVISNVRFDESLKNNEDILFNGLVFQNARKIVFGDETKYLYYEHSSSACNTLSSEQQIKDSINASIILQENSKNERVKLCADKWRFTSSMSYYKLLTKQKRKNEKITKDIRSWLKNNKSALPLLGKKKKLEYYLLLYCTSVYNKLYDFYDNKRNPNWDVSK